VQAGLAFQKVEGAFAFCISSYSKLAEWKAIMDRLSGVTAAMAKVDAYEGAPGTITVEPEQGSNLEVSDVVVRLTNGTPIAHVPKLALAPGQRVLVTGPSGAGKSSLLRALTGLWPPGEGTVALPKDADVMVMPQRPYFPLGTLRQALTYPIPVAQVPDADVRTAMAAVGLGHLASRLDEEVDWAVMLSGGEQQRAAFARVLLRKPAVLMFDEPVSTLDDASGRELYRMLIERLPDTIILSVDRRGVLREFHSETIEMKSADIPRQHAGLAPAPA
jgi:putative ATP-binding cassette transporter